MRILRYSSAYKRAYKKLSRSGIFPKLELESVIKKIQKGETLDAKYQDHFLHGGLSNNRECHIKADLLLVYRIENNDLVLVLVNLGSHLTLF
jgi:mRNA interferase YafQ